MYKELDYCDFFWEKAILVTGHSHKPAPNLGPKLTFLLHFVNSHVKS